MNMQILQEVTSVSVQFKIIWEQILHKIPQTEKEIKNLPQTEKEIKKFNQILTKNKKHYGTIKSK